MENHQFDHAEHLKLLEEAAKELYRQGKGKLGNVVETAHVLHREMQSRIANAKQTIFFMKQAQRKLEDALDNCQKYVTQAKAPWFDCDLFPESTKEG